MSNVDDAVNALNDISDDSTVNPPSDQSAESEPSYPSEVITPTGQAVQLTENPEGIHRADLSGGEEKIV